jgi:phosphoribosyl-ATP pyrophosphohydrolase
MTHQHIDSVLPNDTKQFLQDTLTREIPDLMFAPFFILTENGVAVEMVCMSEITRQKRAIMAMAMLEYAQALVAEQL